MSWDRTAKVGHFSTLFKIVTLRTAQNGTEDGPPPEGARLLKLYAPGGRNIPAVRFFDAVTR